MDQVSAQDKRAIGTSASDQNIIVAAKGGGIAFVGNLFAYASRFAFGFIVARLLGAELLGLYTTGTTAIEVLGVLTISGMTAGMARFIPIAVQQKDRARLWGIIQTGIAIPTLMSSILAFGVFLFAEPLAVGVFGKPALVPVLRWSSLGIPLFALMRALAAMTQGFKQMRYQVYSQDVALNAAKLVFSVALVGFGLGVIGAISAYIAALAITVVMLFFFVHRLFPLNQPLHTAKRNPGEILRFTLPVFLSQFLAQFSGSIETFVLGSFGVMSDVGVYTVALRLNDIGGAFHQALQRIATPVIADLSSRNQVDQLRRFFQTITKWDMTFGLPIFLLNVFFARQLLGIFGSEFADGALGMIILASSTLFNTCTGVAGLMITMSGRSRVTFVNSIISLSINLVLALFFIPRWGRVGAAVAVASTSVLINVLRIVQLFILLRIWPYNRSFAKPVIAALVASGVITVLKPGLSSWAGVLQIIVGALVLYLVYGSVILMLRLSQEDRLILERLRSRLGIRRT